MYRLKLLFQHRVYLNIRCDIICQLRKLCNNLFIKSLITYFNYVYILQYTYYFKIIFIFLVRKFLQMNIRY